MSSIRPDFSLSPATSPSFNPSTAAIDDMLRPYSGGDHLINNSPAFTDEHEAEQIANVKVAHEKEEAQVKAWNTDL